jgi:predicted RNase H-like nuclease (RuvC/YqgF family)
VKPLPPGSTVDVTLEELRKMDIRSLAKLAKQMGVDLNKIAPESSALITALMGKAVG